jgi:hypothetical protein
MSTNLAPHPMMLAYADHDWQPWQQGIVAYCHDKLGFSSFDAAMRALDAAVSARTHDPRRLEFRCYPCPYGRHFHLTSQIQRTEDH